MGAIYSLNDLDKKKPLGVTKKRRDVIKKRRGVTKKRREVIKKIKGFINR